jgi:co-chaperonin GroES (HSP10)
MKTRKKTKSFALALRLRARAATLLITMLCCVTGAWADQEVTIATNLSQTTYTSGDVAITFTDAGDGDGGYVSYDPMTISVSSGVIKSVVLRLGFSAEYAESVHTSGNVGTRTISPKTGSDLNPDDDPDNNDDDWIAVWQDKDTWVTFSGINASSVTIYSDDQVQIDEVKVTYADVVAVNGVTLSPSTATLTVGGTTTLTATVAPSNATNKNVTWSSSNTSVATVSNGVVTAQSVGTATITATTVDGGKTATCAVTVDDPVIVAKYVGKVIAVNGKMYKTLAAANKYSTASGIVAYYGSDVVETGQTYKAIAISLTNRELNNIYCGQNTSCSGSTYGDIATALTVKNGIATTATTLETNVAHGYSHQLYYAAK